MDQWPARIRNNKRKQVAIEAIKCGRMGHSQTMNRKTGFIISYTRKLFFTPCLLFLIAGLLHTPAGYRNNLSTFDIFYQIHFFPVQKLLIDLLLLSLSIALAAGGKQGSACKKYVSYLNLINLSSFLENPMLQKEALDLS